MRSPVYQALDFMSDTALAAGSARNNAGKAGG